MTSRGIRNNNPGNIRKSKDKWQGLADVQTDKEFFTFKSPVWGIRAMARILIKYYDDYELNTIRKIIERWAPPVENNTKAYVNAVARDVGMDAGAELNLHRFADLFPLVKAIIQHENGSQPYSDAEITKGLVLAGVEPEQTSLVKSRTIAASGAAATATVVSTAIETINKAEPTFTLLGKIAEFAPIVLGVLVVAAIGYVIYARIDDRRKGLR